MARRVKTAKIDRAFEVKVVLFHKRSLRRAGYCVKRTHFLSKTCGFYNFLLSFVRKCR
jgi:hypothetical protein